MGVQTVGTAGTGLAGGTNVTPPPGKFAKFFLAQVAEQRRNTPRSAAFRVAWRDCAVRNPRRTGQDVIPHDVILRRAPALRGTLRCSCSDRSAGGNARAACTASVPSTPKPSAHVRSLTPASPPFTMTKVEKPHASSRCHPLALSSPCTVILRRASALRGTLRSACSGSSVAGNARAACTASAPSTPS